MKFALGFLAGIVWFWKGPGSLKFAEFLYDYEVRREDRRDEARAHPVAELFHDWNSPAEDDGSYLCLDVTRDGGAYGPGEPVIFGDSEVVAPGKVIGRRGKLWRVRMDPDPFA